MSAYVRQSDSSKRVRNGVMFGQEKNLGDDPHKHVCQKYNIDQETYLKSLLWKNEFEKRFSRLETHIFGNNTTDDKSKQN